MYKYLALISMVALAACDGNPFPDAGGGGGGGGGTGELPAEIAGNVASASYDAGDDTLSVQLTALDASPVTARFRRTPGLDVPGYEAFTFQENNTQRDFVALFRTNRGITAGVVGDGGQFVNVVQGTTLSRTGGYSRPASGLATYRGNYAGILNGGPSNDPGPFPPARPLRTTGQVQINADFTNDQVNGGIGNRQIVDSGVALDDVFIEITDIEDDGSFTGAVQIVDAGGTRSTVGNYSGLFGGTNANEVGGALFFNPINGRTEITERGVFAIECIQTTPQGVPCRN
jgi:hypothetical protein